MNAAAVATEQWGEKMLHNPDVLPREEALYITVGAKEAKGAKASKD